MTAARIPAGPPPTTSQRRAGSAGSERAGPEARLPAGGRVDGAVDRQPLEDAADAALVAADAVHDLVLAPLARLVRELRVGDLRARHRDHVGLARGEDLLGQRRILDAADREDGEVGLAFTWADRSTRKPSGTSEGSIALKMLW